MFLYTLRNPLLSGDSHFNMGDEFCLSQPLNRGSPSNTAFSLDHMSNSYMTFLLKSQLKSRHELLEALDTLLLLQKISASTHDTSTGLTHLSSHLLKLVSPSPIRQMITGKLHKQRAPQVLRENREHKPSYQNWRL